MKVALIGSCGYIGCLLYEKIKKETFIEVTCFDVVEHGIYPPHIVTKAADIPLEQLENFDVILYFAGLANKTICEKQDYSLTYDINVNDPVELAKKLNNKQLFIYASTGSLYLNKTYICDESEEIDTQTLDKYEKSMLQRELEIQKLNKNTVGLRLGTVIGLSSNFRTNIVLNGFYYSAFAFEKINLWNPNSSRTILWIHDLYTTIDTLLHIKKHTGNIVYNIGSFNATTYEMGKYVSDKTGASLRILHDDGSIGFQMNTKKFQQEYSVTFNGSMELIHKEFLEHKEFILDRVNKNYAKTSKCMICRNTFMKDIIDLGYQPLANDFLNEPMSQEKYELSLKRCTHCFHTQLNYFIEREKLFKTYIYESGTSSTAKKYFQTFAEYYNSIFGNKEVKNVLDIACNDGSQLDEFKKLHWKTFGVDPAANIVKKAIDKGHIVEVKYWGTDTDIQITRNNTFDLIVAQNVLAHVTNPISFLQACECIMTEETLLVVQTSQANMYFNNEFDTIYHEHVSFFTIKSMIYAANSVGCSVVGVRKVPIHGTSYIFEIKKGKHLSSIEELKKEEDMGLYDDYIYNQYRNSVLSMKEHVLKTLQTYKDKNYTCIAFGAAAKANVFLNYIFDSQPNELCPLFIIDDSPLKQGKFTPGTLIHVDSINKLTEYLEKDIVLLILAWNFQDEIISKVKEVSKINSSGNQLDCVCFFPRYKVISLA